MGALLLVALVVAGTPITILHAHDGGGRDHAHDAGASVMADADQDQHDQRDGAPNHEETPSLDTVLHQHDVGTLVSTLSAVPALASPRVMLGTLDAEVPATSPPSADPTPLQRPPIA